MALTYTKISEKLQKDGRIEVLTQFTKNGKFKNKLFLFADSADIVSNFDARMEHAIDVYIAKRTRSITDKEIVERIIVFFQTNTSLPRSTAIAYMNEIKDNEGSF